MAVGAASSVKNRARSIAHRWGPATVVGAGPELFALAIRYDEEDLPTSETFVLRLGPGRAEAVDGMPGTSLAVAACGNAPFVLDSRGTVHAGARRHKLQGARALATTPDGSAVLVAGDLRLWAIDASGEKVEERASVKARLLSSSSAGVLCATDDHKLAHIDGGNVRVLSVRDARGAVSAIHVDSDGKIVAALGKQIISGDLTDGASPIATSSFDIDAVARFAGRVFVSSKIHGLCVVEDGAVQKLRPSVRAHTIATHAGLMVASASLCIATTDDGLEFLTRDLAPFVRIADKTMPRFLQPEDVSI